LRSGGKPMFRTSRFLLLHCLIVGLALLSGGPNPQAADPADVGPLAQSRLVLFETFMRPG
jgi:hypothetical protein